MLFETIDGCNLLVPLRLSFISLIPHAFAT